MAASVAFLHQQEYEAALNEIEEEHRRQEVELLATSLEDDEPAARGNRSSQKLGVRRSAELRRQVLKGAGYNHGRGGAGRASTINNWLSGQHVGEPSSSHRSGSRAPRRAASTVQPLLRRSASMVERPSAWQRIIHTDYRGFVDSVLPILSPDTLWRRSWDLLIMLFVVYTAITVPLSVSFGMPHLQGLDLGVTALFAMDLVLNFRTAFYNYQGEIIRDSGAISRNYMKLWFWIDLFGTIPFDYIVIWMGVIKTTGDNNTTLAALGFLKAPRMLRLGRLLRFLDAFKSAKVFRIVQLFLAMILISHWLACIWYMMYRFGGKDEADEWLFEVETANERGDEVSYYIITYYMSFLLLVGDNITVYNNFERVFSIFVLVGGTFFYSAVVGQMATLVATMNVAVNRHGQKLLMVQDALRYAGVPDEHSEKVQRYFEYLQKRSHPGAEGMQFLQELPTSLHLKLSMYMHRRDLTKVPLFLDCEEGFLAALALRMRMISLSPNEVIFRVGDAGKEMYIIKKGHVAVTSPSLQMWGLMQPGEIFGEVALLSTGKRTANCVALGFVDLAVLTGPDLHVVMRDYPVSAALIHQRAAERAHSLQSRTKMWLQVSDEEWEEEGGEEEEQDHCSVGSGEAAHPDGDAGSISSLESAGGGGGSGGDEGNGAVEGKSEVEGGSHVAVLVQPSFPTAPPGAVAVVADPNARAARGPRPMSAVNGKPLPTAWISSADPSNAGSGAPDSSPHAALSFTVPPGATAQGATTPVIPRLSLELLAVHKLSSGAGHTANHATAATGVPIAHTSHLYGMGPAAHPRGPREAAALSWPQQPRTPTDAAAVTPHSQHDGQTPAPQPRLLHHASTRRRGSALWLPPPEQEASGSGPPGAQKDPDSIVWLAPRRLDAAHRRSSSIHSVPRRSSAVGDEEELSMAGGGGEASSRAGAGTGGALSHQRRSSLELPNQPSSRSQRHNPHHGPHQQHSHHKRSSNHQQHRHSGHASPFRAASRDLRNIPVVGRRGSDNLGAFDSSTADELNGLGSEQLASPIRQLDNLMSIASHGSGYRLAPRRQGSSRVGESGAGAPLPGHSAAAAAAVAAVAAAIAGDPSWEHAAEAAVAASASLTGVPPGGAHTPAGGPGPVAEGLDPAAAPPAAPAGGQPGVAAVRMRRGSAESGSLFSGRASPVLGSGYDSAVQSPKGLTGILRRKLPTGDGPQSPVPGAGAAGGLLSAIAAPSAAALLSNTSMLRVRRRNSAVEPNLDSPVMASAARRVAADAGPAGGDRDGAVSPAAQDSDVDGFQPSGKDPEWFSWAAAKRKSADTGSPAAASLRSGHRTSTGGYPGGSSQRHRHSSASGLAPLPPPRPPPPPDGVFVPRAAWNQLLLAASRLVSFESIVQQLLDLVSEQDDALGRLEARAERAAQTGAMEPAAASVLGIIAPGMGGGGSGPGNAIGNGSSGTITSGSNWQLGISGSGMQRASGVLGNSILGSATAGFGSAVAGRRVGATGQLSSSGGGSGGSGGGTAMVAAAAAAHGALSKNPSARARVQGVARAIGIGSRMTKRGTAGGSSGARQFASSSQVPIPPGMLDVPPGGHGNVDGQRVLGSNDADAPGRSQSVTLGVFHGARTESDTRPGYRTALGRELGEASAAPRGMTPSPVAFGDWLDRSAGSATGGRNLSGTVRGSWDVAELSHTASGRAAARLEAGGQGPSQGPAHVGGSGSGSMSILKSAILGAATAAGADDKSPSVSPRRGSLKK